MPGFFVKNPAAAAGVTGIALVTKPM